MHLTKDDRQTIENELNHNHSLKQIASLVNKHPSSISREIRNHYITKNTGGYGRPFNHCLYRLTCPVRKNCQLQHCIKFEEEKCPKLNHPPYVCNGCSKKHLCTLSKRYYDANYAHDEYLSVLQESRSGVVIDKKEINYLNSILTPLIKNRKQSIHHAIINNKNLIMYSESKIYKLIDLGLLEVRNIDLPRKVRFRNRVKQSKVYKIDKNCLENRTYEDFLKYMEENPDTPIVEMDTVEGLKGGKVLLTIHFVNCSFMLAFIRDHNTAQSVIDIFNFLQDLLGIDKFKEMFVLILTDNGPEFSNPVEIEFDNDTGEKRTQIFYCHPSSPNEKGSCEVNHELIRRILPKGTSFESLNQNDINLMMSHINSYKRKKLNNVSPITLFETIYGKDTLDKLQIQEIESNLINLSTTLLKNR